MYKTDYLQEMCLVVIGLKTLMGISDMKTVKLLGELGKKFGKSFNLDIKNPAEAVRALCVNFPELKDHLINSEKRGIGYKVLVGSESQALDDLHNPSGKQTIKFVPVLMGAGGGLTNVIIGAVLVVAGFVASFTPFAAASPYLYAMGVSMMIGGVVQMLTPVPKVSSQEMNNQPDNKPSYIFNGAVNTSAQGYPVPVGYGRMIVGSAVISAGIFVEEL
jgi:predicted phage tail protein